MYQVLFANIILHQTDRHGKLLIRVPDVHHSAVFLHHCPHTAHSLLAVLDLLIVRLLVLHGFPLHIGAHDLRHTGAEIAAPHAGDEDSDA